MSSASSSSSTQNNNNNNNNSYSIATATANPFTFAASQSSSHVNGSNTAFGGVGGGGYGASSPTSPAPHTPSWNTTGGVTTTNAGGNNVVLQTLKRRTNKVVVPLDERVVLEKVFGFTVSSNARLSQSCDGTIAYLAGCVIVLYDPNTQKQDFIISQARKTLTTVAFSADGRTLATGESGHDPKVRVWDVRDKVQICEFGSHKFAIECVCFSANSNLIISIGSMHDMVVNVWNVHKRFKVACNKIACKVRGISFSRDGSYFVTVGNRHVKFWYLTVSSLMETVPLKGRAAILGDLKNNYFCDVVCGDGDCINLTYAITTNGILCEFNENRCLSRAIELHTERAYCIHADSYNLFIGCSNGSILIFRQKGLEFAASMPLPHPLGVDISKGTDTRHLMENLSQHELLKYPDCVALCYDPYTCVLSTIYNDHSIYVWELKDISKIKKLDSHLFHSSCCWSLDTFSSAGSTSADNTCLPADSFITCSTDNTIRIWSPVVSNLSTSSTSSSSSSSSANLHKLKPNIYSKELLKILYIDNDLSGLCEIEQLSENGGNEPTTTTTTPGPTAGNTALSSQSITNLPTSSFSITNNNNSNSSSLDKLGARCVKISPNGRHLATGDRNGNIKIYDLASLESVCLIEAHDGEVLYLQYSQPESGRLLLASSSRDRLIHIFDASKTTHDLLQTLDDHSAAITAVRFSYNPLEKQLHVISCGADKSIMFRSATTPHDSSALSSSSTSSSSSSSSPSSPTNHLGNSHHSSQPVQFVRTSYVAEKQTFYDLNIDPTRNYINTISQDRMIRTYSIKDGKKLRQFRGSLNEDGYLLKMDTTSNGALLAASCSDKCVYVWDLNTCECVAYICGHSEVVTDLKFTSDNQHLITVSADGCVFIWKLNSLANTATAAINNACNTAPYASSPLPSPLPATPSVNGFNFGAATATTTTTTTSWSTRKSSQPAAPVAAALKQQQSLDTIFDSDTEALPSWARNKLNQAATATGSMKHSSSSGMISKVAASLPPLSSSVATTPTGAGPGAERRSSGRAVWGPVLNTNFAVMLETNSTSSETGASSSSTVAYAVENTEQQDTENTSSAAFDGFPSPCVDKDYFQIKQVKLNMCETTVGQSNRMSWFSTSPSDAGTATTVNACSVDGLDGDHGTHVAAAESITLSTKEGSMIDDDLLSSSFSSSSVNKLVATGVNSHNKSGAGVTSSTPNSPRPVSESITSQAAKLTCSSALKESSSSSLPSSSIIKLECDMENSLRRQSISARYLLRTQKQLQLQNHGDTCGGVLSEKSSRSPSRFSSGHQQPIIVGNSEASSSSSRNSLRFSVQENTAENTAAPEPVKPEPKSGGAGVSAAQMAADLLKMRRRATAAAAILASGSGGSSFQQLYSQHTESSLNKTKQKHAATATTPSHNHHSNQAQNSSSSSIIRSPSMSSIINNGNSSGNSSDGSVTDHSSSNNSNAQAANESSTVTPTFRSHSSALKPTTLPSKSLFGTTRQSSVSKTNSVASENTATKNSSNSAASSTSSTSNLKKATSMLSLFTASQGGGQPSTITTSSPAKQAGNRNSVGPQNSQLINAAAAAAAANILPPKTLRQIKQRSAERQMTSSSILSTYTPPIPPPPPSAAASSSTSNTPTHRNSSCSFTASKFNEQNKHLKKLSNSIQNLHQTTGAGGVLSLPKSAQPDNKMAAVATLHLKSVDNDVETLMLDSRVPDPAVVSLNDKMEYMEHDLPSSSSSSTASQNDADADDDYQEQENYAEQDQDEADQDQDQDQEDNENDHNNFLSSLDDEKLQDDHHRHSHHRGHRGGQGGGNQQASSNSLTSSSSSSCSLFSNDNNNNTGNGPNGANLTAAITDAVDSKCLDLIDGQKNSSSTASTATSEDVTCSGGNTAATTTLAGAKIDLNDSRGSMSSSSAAGGTGTLKKPITFASIAAAAAAAAGGVTSSSGGPLATHNLASALSPNTSVCSKLTANQGSSSSSSSASSAPLTSSKIEAIRNEFKQNLYLLGLMHENCVANQTSSHHHHQFANHAGNNHHQTILLMEKINTSLQPIIKNWSLTNPVTTYSTPAQSQQQKSSTLNTSSNEADFEII